jgi:hypothetical protein
MRAAKRQARRLTPLEEYLERHGAMLSHAESVVTRALASGKRVSVGDVAFAVWNKMREPCKQWRIAYVITTAYHLGAFKGSGFWLRRGVGFTSKRHLRLLK